jgi:hypothetical protein
MLDVLNALVKAIESREPVALATVIDVQGASPARATSTRPGESRGPDRRNGCLR